MRSLAKYLTAEVFSLFPDRKLGREVINIAVTWHLKVTVITGWFAGFASWLVLFQQWMFVVVVGWILLLLGGWIYVVSPVLFSPIGYLNREIICTQESSWRDMYLAARDLTEAYFYSRMITVLHVVLLIGNLAKIVLGS